MKYCESLGLAWGQAQGINRCKAMPKDLKDLNLLDPLNRLIPWAWPQANPKGLKALND